ncbi:MAG: hypothetical protein KDC38_20510 [Planctomycetes bacterium]|nr:hypothetical protein [Planctomycetota bacterium]
MSGGCTVNGKRMMIGVLVLMSVVGGRAIASRSAYAQDVAKARDAQVDAGKSDEKTGTAEDPAKAAREKERKRAGLEREMRVAVGRLELARFEVESAEIDAISEIARAQRELELARQQLAEFDELTRPLRTKRAQLDLQQSRDSVRENEQELEQLEMMYNDQQIADATKEIVLERGRRRLERARQRLTIEEQEVQKLETHTLPREREGLELAVREKEDGLARRQRTAESTRMEKHLGILGAENEVARIQSELEAL